MVLGHDPSRHSVGDDAVVVLAHTPSLATGRAFARVHHHTTLVANLNGSVGFEKYKTNVVFVMN